jgi:basic amino acid/polyamine antiporter, APA family
VVFFAFLGFEGITAIAEESINPKKDVPRAVVGGITFVTTMYAISSFILLSVAPTAGLDYATASAEVFNIVGNPTVAKFVYIGAFLGIFSATYTCFVP